MHLCGATFSVLAASVTVQALANDDLVTVARFFFFLRSGPTMASSGSRWIAVAFYGFLSGEWAQRFCFCLRCLSQTMFTTRAFTVLRQYPTPTTVFTPPTLLLLPFCRTTHDLGLGLQLIVLHPELVPLQQQRNGDAEQKGPKRMGLAMFAVSRIAR